MICGSRFHRVGFSAAVLPFTVNPTQYINDNNIIMITLTDLRSFSKQYPSLSKHIPFSKEYLVRLPFHHPPCGKLSLGKTLGDRTSVIVPRGHMLKP